MSGFIRTLCGVRLGPERALVLGALRMKQPQHATSQDMLQMDAILGQAGQARLGFEDSLSAVVFFCWADRSHQCPPQSSGARTRVPCRGLAGAQWSRKASESFTL